MDLKLEKSLFGRGYDYIAGVDEAGRGPLAGPVVAACVLIPKNFVIPPDLSAVNDSKKISASSRRELFQAIIKNKLVYGLGICSPQMIDKINILQATWRAMRQAIRKTGIEPDMILVDGRLLIPGIRQKQQAIIHGDGKIFSIAVASIIAKVKRDQLMERMHQKYPEYGFNRHKGYGTKLHCAQIKKFGPSPIHRLSFARVKD